MWILIGVTIVIILCWIALWSAIEVIDLDIDYDEGEDTRL